MRTWYERQPSVFEEEKNLLEALGFTLDLKLLEAAKVVAFTGASKTDSRRRLRVVFPSGYPSFAPEVFDESTEPLLTRHHHAEHRGFCLFGPDRNRWISSMTAANALAEVEELIRDYAPGSAPVLAGEVPEPVSDLIATAPAGGILVPPPVASLLIASSRIAATGTCQILMTTDPKAHRRGVVVNLELNGAKATAPGYQRPLSGQTTQARNIPVIRLGAPPPMISRHTGAGAWLQLVPASLRRTQNEEWFLFVYPEESGRAEDAGTGMTLLQVSKQGHTCHRCYSLAPEAAFTRIPGLENLAAKKVVIVGLGALGSRIAVCLAASGVRKFFFLDHDIYDTANAVRHECGFAFFGVPKVQAVAQRVLEMNPLCEIGFCAARVGSLPANEEAELVKRMNESALVINATGSEHAAHWLDRMCQELGRRCLHAAVANGAWSGEVIRVVPGRTPCWVCHQIAHEPLASEPRANGGFFPAGCAHPTFTGSMPEVALVAELTAAMAIETMLEREGRDFSGSHIRWAARSITGAWSPKIEVVTPPFRPECAVCSPVPKSPGTSS